ncbi:MAG: secreted protein [Candidatus Magnetoglobus multicellularis str. Araruama]|uniref:Secreted protein n=1 Tax=Candidatus Magnetoglobus multicellularis str. Araruama TaxID=890399 RepID=A0A1V1P7B7_9BACT|nr:MAG: secreted protein [Candidatus Magnetoglobus multicellularis str. Araruama]
MGLAIEDDTGQSSEDHLTKQFNNLTINGSGIEGTEIHLYEKNSLLGSGAVHNNTFSIDVSFSSEGEHCITATQIISSEISDASNELCIHIDTTKPLPPVVSGVGITNNQRPVWEWSSSNTGDNQNDGNGNFCITLDDSDTCYQTQTTTFIPDTALAHGYHTLYVKEQDASGNWSDAGSYTILIDLIGPKGNITISNSEWTDTRFVTLSIAPQDMSNVSKIRLSNDGIHYSEDIDFIETINQWELTDEDGLKTVYVQFQDHLGNWSEPYTDTIGLDTTPPQVTMGCPQYSNSTEGIFIKWSADDLSGCGVKSSTLFYKIDDGGGYDQLSFTNGSNPYKLTFMPKNGKYTFKLSSEDCFGHVSETKEYVMIFDTEAPHSMIESAPAFVNDLTKTFTITYSYENDLSGIESIELWVKKEPVDTVFTQKEYVLIAQNEPADSNGTFQFTTTTEGKYYFYTIAADKAGNREEPPETFDQTTLYTSNVPGYAILAIGATNDQEGQQEYAKTAEQVYGYLVNNNFTLGSGTNDYHDNVKFFNPGEQVINGQDSFEDTYKNDLQKSIETWAFEKMKYINAPLYIILIGHGDTDQFYLSEGNYLTSKNAISDSSDGLHDWLENLENKLAENHIDQDIIIILGSCYSGSFIDDLSKAGRIIITSTSENEQSYRGHIDSTGVRNGEFFVSALFTELARGYNLNKSFSIAAQMTHNHTYDSYWINQPPYYDSVRQHPLLDDVSQHADKIQFKTIDPNGLKFTDFGKIESGSIADNVNQATLWAQLNDNSKVDEVWVEILAPDTETAEVDKQWFIETTRIPMILQSGQYVSSYTGFTASGKYTVFFYARDKQGLISTVEKQYIYKDKSGENVAPGSFRLRYPNDGTQTTTKRGLIALWEESIDPDGDLVTYTLEIWNNDFYDKREGITTNSYKINMTEGFDEPYTYTWQVTAIDAYGAKTICQKQRWFVIDNTGGVADAFNDQLLTGEVRDAITKKMISSANVEINPALQLFSIKNGVYLADCSLDDCNEKFSIHADADGYHSKTISNISIEKKVGLIKDIYLVRTDLLAQLIHVLNGLTLMQSSENCKRCSH